MRYMRILTIFAIFSIGLGLLWAGPTVPALAAPIRQDNGDSSVTTVYHLRFEGAVTPVLEQYITRGIRQAAAAERGLVVLALDTPGGSVAVTQSIIQTMLAAPVPMVVYIAPSGARAGSAGTFVTLAAHVAAMAPATSIGAASPVDSSGGDIDETMAAKVTNMLSAEIENLAARRGEEATAWAIAAVQDAAAATADEALALGVIDVIAADLPDLLAQLDGRTVTVDGAPLQLQTSRTTITEIELSLLQRLLNFLTDPTLATILLSLAILGITVEVYTPGFGFPGILGVVCLLLAFFGLGQLDANFTGLALMGVALALFIAEAFTPTFGVLALGGTVAFVLGGVLLLDEPGLPIPWFTLILLALLMGGFALFAGQRGWKAQRQPAKMGSEALIGQTVTAKSALAAGQTGNVFIQGEWWNARLLRGEIAAGQTVRVVGRQGLTLLVEPAATPSLEDPP